MNKQYQQGFAHAVLIIGLVIALIGALGFVFWQNFIYKEPVAQEQTSVTQKPTAQNEETSKSTAKTLAVTEWGISINKPGNNDSYKYIPQDNFAVWLTNDELSQALEGCGIKGVQLSKITASSATDNAREYSKEIMGYKYGIAKSLPAASAFDCPYTQNIANVFEKTRDALLLEVKTIQ